MTRHLGEDERARMTRGGTGMLAVAEGLALLDAGSAGMGP